MDQNEIAGKPKPPLFHDVWYAISNLADPDLMEAAAELDRHGATRVGLDLDTNRVRDIYKITHLLASTTDFPDYVDAINTFVNVVKPSWVTASLKAKRVSNPRLHTPDPALFMSNVTVFCSDIPDGDVEAIHAAVLALGGVTSHAMNRTVTHIVALEGSEPLETAARNRLTAKTILPHWFDDCLRVRRRVPEGPYLHPNPPLLDKEKYSPAMLIADSDATQSQSSQDSAATHPRAVFKGKKMMLSADLPLSKSARSMLETIIEASGGRCVSAVRDADVFVCEYRDGADFSTAALDGGIAIGNLAWLYHLAVHDRWASPLLRQTHYPRPRGGVPGFGSYMITLSGYSGAARVHLEQLAVAAGARFSRTLTRDNTHLLSAAARGEKSDAAREWGMPLVNHLWLEDSYAKHAPQSTGGAGYRPADPEGSAGPGQPVGQTPIDMDTVQMHFLRRGAASGSPLKSAATSVTATASTPAAPPVYADVKAIPPREQAAPVGQHRRRTDGGVLAAVNAQTPKRRPGRPRRVSAAAPPSPPLSVGASDKENRVPAEGRSGRQAKANALGKLHDNALDMIRYEKERKRVGGVTHGREKGARGAEEQAVVRAASPKRKHDETEDEDVPSGKKARVGRPPGKMRVLVSMYDRWLEKPELIPKDKNKLRSMGIHVIDDPSSTPFVLCAPRIGRTKKFVCALAYGPTIVSTAFLDECLTGKAEPPEADDCPLDDAAGEARLGCSLAEATRRARANGRRLLKGWQVFVTDRAAGGGVETLRAIVETNGGACIAYGERTHMKASRRALDAADGRAGEEDQLFLVSGTSAQEKALWGRFRDMAREADMVPMIVSTDWLLGVAMAQKVMWRDEWGLDSS